MKVFDKKIIGLIIGAVFIALILKNIDIHKSIEAVKHLNWFYLTLMIPAYYSAFIFRSLRWHTILSEKKEIKFSSLLNAIFRGWLANSIVPARGGELYRAHYFGKKEGISRVTILASIVLERIFDGLILFLILFFLAAFVFSSKKFFGVAVAAGIIFIGTFSVLLLITKFYKNTFAKETDKHLLTNNDDQDKKEKAGFLILKIKENNFIKKFLNEKICEILSKIFNKATSAIISFMNGLEIFNSPVLILKTLFFTLLVWLCEGLNFFLIIKAFGYSIGILGSLFVLSIIAFISLIPGGPAGLGPVQWGYIISLKFFHISQETAFAVSIIGQIFSILLICLGCLFFIIGDNLKLNPLAEETQIN